MKKVPIAQVEPGGVVARPVSTGSGMLMVQAGAVLTGEIIGRLVNLGIDNVWLEGAAEDAVPLDLQLAALDRRFVGHEDNALMLELKAVVARRIQQGTAVDRD
jgi:hypothetical protein